MGAMRREKWSALEDDFRTFLRDAEAENAHIC
jgi:hypothetical protein